MGMLDNKGPNDEMPYGLTRRQPVNSPDRGLGRFAERNAVTGVESGQSTVNPVNRLGRPVPTKEEVEQRIQQHIAEYEKSKKFLKPTNK